MLSLKNMQGKIMANKIKKGFNSTDINQEFCFLYAEVGEAYDAWFKKKDDLGEELADVAIFLMSIADILGYDLGNEIEKKVIKNENRIYKEINGVKVKVGE